VKDRFDNANNSLHLLDFMAELASLDCNAAHYGLELPHDLYNFKNGISRRMVSRSLRRCAGNDLALSKIKVFRFSVKREPKLRPKL
jgi:hypothetical protein